MPESKLIRRLAGLVLVVLLLASACGDDSGGDDQAEAERGDPTSFSIWVPDNLSREMDRILRLFKQNRPDITVDMVTGTAIELNDKLLLGERPDLFVGTAIQVDTLVDEGTLPDDRVDLGTNPLMIVVAAGNPKQITDVTVFGADPTTKSGLCTPEIACGKAARNALSQARVSGAPDTYEPDARSLLNKVASGDLDAGMLFRTETAKAERDGRVSTVATPTASTVEVTYRIAVVRRGDAVDAFLDYLSRSSGVQKVLQNAGLAPVTEPVP